MVFSSYQCIHFKIEENCQIVESQSWTFIKHQKQFRQKMSQTTYVILKFKKKMSLLYPTETSSPSCKQPALQLAIIKGMHQGTGNSQCIHHLSKEWHPWCDLISKKIKRKQISHLSTHNASYPYKTMKGGVKFRIHGVYGVLKCQFSKRERKEIPTKISALQKRDFLLHQLQQWPLSITPTPSPNPTKPCQ